jgi:hypothetical protein
VQTANGYAVLLVESITTLPLSQVHDEAKTLASGGSEQAMSAFLLNAAKSASVTVDPRYGTWDASRAQVTPPTAATSVSTAVTTAAPAAGDIATSTTTGG